MIVDRLPLWQQRALAIEDTARDLTAEMLQGGLTAKEIIEVADAIVKFALRVDDAESAMPNISTSLQ